MFRRETARGSADASSGRSPISGGPTRDDVENVSETDRLAILDMVKNEGLSIPEAQEKLLGMKQVPRFSSF